MKKRTWLLAAAAVAAVAGMLTAPARADIIILTPSFTLQQVMDMPGGLVVFDKTFSNFTYRSTSQGGALAPTAEGISVIGIKVTFSDRTEYGLVFQGSWSADGNKSADSFITFKVEANAPFLISDNTLWMVGSGRNGGMASVTELATRTNPPESDGDVLANKFVFSNDSNQHLVDHMTYPDAYKIVYVSKDIQVNGGTSQTGSAAISVVYQTFSQVPEPATMALLALGGGVILFRRRRGRRS